MLELLFEDQGGDSLKVISARYAQNSNIDLVYVMHDFSFQLFQDTWLTDTFFNVNIFFEFCWSYSMHVC